MNNAFRNASIGCGGIIALIVIAVIALGILTEPGKAPPHKFDSYRLDYDACMTAFDGRIPVGYNDIWVLASPDLRAWWAPNGMRAEADLILESNDPRVINDLISCIPPSGEMGNSVRTLAHGRIYHVLLFNQASRSYAHLRFCYRSEQADGSTIFSLDIIYKGAHPIKACPRFLGFEKCWLGNGNNKVHPAN